MLLEHTISRQRDLELIKFILVMYILHNGGGHYYYVFWLQITLKHCTTGGGRGTLILDCGKELLFDWPPFLWHHILLSPYFIPNSIWLAPLFYKKTTKNIFEALLPFLSFF